MPIVTRPCAARNFRPGRPSHLQVDAVVIHTTTGPLTELEAAFANNELVDPRSAHYGIGKAGDVRRYVDDSDTAFHAGTIVSPTWTGLKRGVAGELINPNFYTIGIEHEGPENGPWTDQMYGASAVLLRELSERHPGLGTLSRNNVVPHRDIRTDRSCPGPLVDVDRLLFAATGVAVAANDPAPAQLMQLRTRAALNVRRGSPTTRAGVVRVIEPGHVVNVVREVSGERVTGVSRWYENVDGDFLWGGALEDPTEE